MKEKKYAFWSVLEKDLSASHLTVGRAMFNASFRAVVAYRIYSCVYKNYSKALGYVLYQRCIRRYGVDIAPSADIGPGLHISHLGAIVVGRNVVIGDNAILNSGVTLGMKNSLDDFMPHCGNNLNVGTGAKILGKVTLGDNVLVGANSVVLIDIPSDSVSVGVPARVINRQ